MPHHRVLITDHPWSGLDVEEGILSPHDIELVDAPTSDEQTLCSLARDVDAITTCWAHVTEGVIRAAENCRVICRFGIGLDNIAIPAATERGIPVTNVPDYCVEEVADHTLALLLGLKRNIAFFHLRTKQGEYNLKSGPIMRRLHGRRLGLIGFGRIGRAVYERARSFGLEVVASTPSGNDYGTDCPMIAYEELLRTSDIISLHAPLTDATLHLVDARALSAMPPGVILVNTSRGGLIDAGALTDAIHSGHVAGAGLDVFEPEPPDLDLALYQHERVIVTPHAAFVSQESVMELRERVARQVLDVFSGHRPENVVNPDVLPD